MTEFEDTQATRDHFAALLTAAIRRAGEQRPIEYNAEQFQLQIAEGGFINLSNVFRAWLETAAENREKVIQQTVRETLPEGFQRSEFLLDHGALDLIVDRRDMREKLGSLLRQLMGQPAASTASAAATPPQ